MSATMVMTMAPAETTSAACCPSCGYNLPPFDTTHAELLQAQARIADLETQVRLLNQKATAAVDRWADYEDELTRLRGQVPPPPPEKEPHVRASFLQSGTNRLSALLSPRKSTPNLRTDPSRPINPQTISQPAPPSPTEQDLLQALSRETNLRKEAEGRLSATSKEVEELSAALFEQANEMVAEERRARARLEERVGELERRDNEKRRRLERLEVAMRRIERVRSLLAEGEEEERQLQREKDEAAAAERERESIDA
ncbi:Fc.00g051690.m01.CDS01 [Cosmosporella sp. VM-42]